MQYTPMERMVKGKVPGAGIEAEEAIGLHNAVHTNRENREGEGHHEAGESDVFRTHLSKHKSTCIDDA